MSKDIRIVFRGREIFVLGKIVRGEPLTDEDQPIWNNIITKTSTIERRKLERIRATA